MAIRILFLIVIAALFGPSATVGEAGYSTDRPGGRFSNYDQLATPPGPVVPPDLPRDPCLDAGLAPAHDLAGHPVPPANVFDPGGNTAPYVSLDGDRRGRGRRGRPGLDIGDIGVDTGTGVVDLNGAPLNPGRGDPFGCFDTALPPPIPDTLK